MKLSDPKGVKSQALKKLYSAGHKNVGHAVKVINNPLLTAAGVKSDSEFYKDAKAYGILWEENSIRVVPPRFR